MHVRGEDASNVTVAAVTSAFFVLIVFAETIDCSLQTEVNYSISVNNIHFYFRCGPKGCNPGYLSFFWTT
jgi:hypothetical protein